MFGRIQNLHISQTSLIIFVTTIGLVEFKIYISLKQETKKLMDQFSLVEFKIYISLKLEMLVSKYLKCLVEFKIYISLKPKNYWRLS